jgi:putative peptidoglycan lipid II flippase
MANLLARARRLAMREYTISEASGILILSFFLSAVLGAVRQVLFNAQFGTGQEANAYYAASRLPDTLFNLIAGGALSSAMIPVLLSTWRSEGEQAGQHLINLVLTTLLTTVACLVVVCMVFAPVFVTHVLAPGFDAATSRLTTRLTRMMLVEPLMLALGAVAFAVLNSRNQFFLPALSVVSHNFTIIAGIVLAGVFPGVGIYGPTIGAISGAGLQVLVMLPGLIGRHMRLRPAWNPWDRRLHEVIRLMIPNGLSLFVGYAGFILDTSFASRAPEAAALPAIHNAWLLAGLPVTLLGGAIGQSVFPRLSAYVVTHSWKEMRRTLLRVLGISMLLSLPVALGLLLFGRLVVQILFEHGRFDAPAGLLTYTVLAVYVVALPAYIATELITRGLIAMRDTRTPLFTNSAQLAGRVVLILWLMPRLGVVAIPVAFAVTSSLEAIVLGVMLALKLRRRLRQDGIG